MPKIISPAPRRCAFIPHPIRYLFFFHLRSNSPNLLPFFFLIQFQTLKLSCHQTVSEAVSPEFSIMKIPIQIYVQCTYNNILLYYTFVQIFSISKSIKYNIIGNIFYFKIDILNLLECSRIKMTPRYIMSIYIFTYECYALCI